jgi:hypothetical protein
MVVRGDDDGQILHRQPPHRPAGSHQPGHEAPDGGGREELPLEVERPAMGWRAEHDIAGLVSPGLGHRG